MVLFGSLEAGRSVFVSAGSKQAVSGSLDRTGFVVMEATGAGLTRESLGGDRSIPVFRHVTQTSAMVGYQYSANGLYAAFYLGPEVTHEQLTITGQVLRWSKPRTGSRAQVELWAHPVRDGLFTGTLVASTTEASLWGRVSGGWRLWKQAFLGPEAGFYVTDTYREARFGAHLTSLAVGLVHFRVSGGWQVTDDGRRGAPYLGLASWIRL